MHKELLLLGLLQSGPKTGYDLYRIIAAHGELYTDLKKGNVYYLIERLTESGYLQVKLEAGARGPRRERLIYTLTDQGLQHFTDLLRDVVRTYELAHTGVEVGMVFLSYLPVDEAIQLLEERRQAIIMRRALVVQEIRADAPVAMQLAQDHLLSLMDAELIWSTRALERLSRESEVSATVSYAVGHSSGS
ncbi:MAG: PadR family transcriptional regulator [Herpetosiphonaceae bacterium]|nr:PadR family transcriptional regulator [Herpetosiphonaceae bacterium]